jgi:hypothetical protein
MKEGIMTVPEQMWFIIGVSGFLIFFEAAIIKIIKGFWKILYKEKVVHRWWKDKYNDTAKIIAGLIIFAIALYNLFSLARA